MTGPTLPLVRYLTNQVIAWVPSYTLRHAWYRRVLGMAIGEGAAVQMGQFVHIRGRTRAGERGIAIGRRTVINRGCCLDGRGWLRIGDDVNISAGSWLLTDSHDHEDPHFREVLAPVTIEDHAWIGSRALVLPGVTIGEGAVVGAKSVVAEDVPPFTVVGGNPARVLRRLIGEG